MEWVTPIPARYAKPPWFLVDDSDAILRNSMDLALVGSIHDVWNDR